MLAEAGLGSRREIERLVADGRVAVNGRQAKLGDRLTGDERVVVNGKPVRLRVSAAPHSYLAYYKPAGEVTTTDDPEGRPTVFDQLPRPDRGRWINVGRLDMNTSGLLLLTTDGELAHRLMHPRYEVSREYAVRLLGEPTEEQWRQLRSGVMLEDGVASFDSVEARGGTGRNAWFHVTLREGRNREVRRMFEALGLTVSRLIRVRYGPLQLGRMQRARTRRLSHVEVASLYSAVDLPAPSNTPSSTEESKRLRNARGASASRTRSGSSQRREDMPRSRRARTAENATGGATTRGGTTSGGSARGGTTRGGSTRGGTPRSGTKRSDAERSSTRRSSAKGTDTKRSDAERSSTKRSETKRSSTKRSETKRSSGGKRGEAERRGDTKRSSTAARAGAQASPSRKRSRSGQP